jgi:hypothetical protein
MKEAPRAYRSQGLFCFHQARQGEDSGAVFPLFGRLSRTVLLRDKNYRAVAFHKLVPPAERY